MSNESGGRFPVAKNLRVEELLQLYEDIMPEVDQLLAESNISGPLDIPRAPEGLEDVMLYGPHNDPLPPEDLTNLESTQLGKCFSFMQNWTNYVQAEMTRIKCIFDIQDRQNEIVRSALRKYYAEGPTPPAGYLLDDCVNTDSRFIQCDVAREKLKAIYKTAEARYETLKRSLNNLSREQTRRGEELQREIHSERGGRPPNFRR